VAGVAFTLPKLPPRPLGPVMASSAQPPPASFTLSWQDPNLIAEVECSTDLVNWAFYTNVPAPRVCCVVPNDAPAKFFRVRARDASTGEVSLWATK